MVALYDRVNDNLKVFAQVTRFGNGLTQVPATILTQEFHLDRETNRCIYIYDEGNELFQFIRWVQRLYIQTFDLL